MKNEITLIVDASYIGHRARFTTGNLTDEKGVGTGVIYGFLNSIKDIGFGFNTNNFAFCWDSEKSIRKRLFPAYKNKQGKDITPEEKAKKEDALRQFSLLRRKILPDIGFKNNLIQSRYEADDIIASLVMHTTEGRTIIISADHDLYQLLPYADMYDPRTRRIYTERDFIYEWGIRPEEWWKVKAIAGCKSDNVIGVSNVGEKTAVSYLKNELKTSSKSYEKIQQHINSGVYDKNVKLVKLPMKGTTKIKKLQENQFQLYELLNWAKTLNFKSYENMKVRSEWGTLFKAPKKGPSIL